MKRIAPALALVVGLTTSGCLQKDTISTIYLRQDGSLDWVISERNIRSDEADPTKRAAEESGYIEAAARDEHGLATTFRALGGEFVRTRVLRDRRPYEVMTEARFVSLSDVFGRALASCGVPHRVELTTDNGVTTWRLWADVGEDGDNAPGGDTAECESIISELSDWSQFSIRLESGRFTNATGFAIENSDTAILDQTITNSEHLAKSLGQVTFSLSWTRLVD